MLHFRLSSCILAAILLSSPAEAQTETKIGDWFVIDHSGPAGLKCIVQNDGPKGSIGFVHTIKEGTVLSILDNQNVNNPFDGQKQFKVTLKVGLETYQAMTTQVYRHLARIALRWQADVVMGMIADGGQRGDVLTIPYPGHTYPIQGSREAFRAFNTCITRNAVSPF
ncbi:hypothetical protein SAMN05421763_11411 [[Luteovulum] sphaeroides subsp. megalophilum]|uniref:hypothetical protein n=1 Tax=Cereibacter sphaeroides TaxID=1063 RepID=UPI000B6729E7|nr:hypothetical protein [Cereibacter sphaeroides]SNT39328.1 hypothetical protein SAMN05421763_11411 [[Luteovulum] sphaeroides subsp. megalophilum]